MGHQDNSLCPRSKGMFNSWDSTDDTLGVGDLAISIERDVEVNLEGIIV